APAPWRTVWAYLGYVVLGAAAAYGFARWRSRSLRRRNQELEARVTERTRQLEAINAKLVSKNHELDKANANLVASNQRADRMFSPLTEALPGTVPDGKYRLEKKIGEGGFGAVFSATHLDLARIVAVKVFRPAHANDSASGLERFRREGSAASRLN